MSPLETFTFCLRCGSDFKKTGGHLKCASCGLEYYNAPKPGVTVLLHDERSRYMLVKRRHEPSKNRWDIPGGFVEAGETFEEAARREIKEEIGVELSELRYASSGINIYRYQGVDYPIVDVNLQAQVTSDTIFQPTDDITDYAFFSAAEIPWDNLAFTSVENELRRTLNASK